MEPRLDQPTTALPTIWPHWEQLHKHSQELAYLLGRWSARYVKPVVDTDAIPHPRKAAGDALDEIDAMLRTLHTLRSALITEILRFDEQTAARVDELLARTRNADVPVLPSSSRTPGGARGGGHDA